MMTVKILILIAAPLTSLLKGKPKKLSWTQPGQMAFETLKGRFTTDPILKHLNPDLPFIIEVDASDKGIGAVLTQIHGNPGKKVSFCFFSRKLTTAERNYDVGNKDLLSIKAALEEWRHWLEGAHHPFQVITDHKNLEYIRSAKHLNPRQAHWSFFFTRFQFTHLSSRVARIVKPMPCLENMTRIKLPSAKDQFYLLQSL